MLPEKKNIPLLVLALQLILVQASFSQGTGKQRGGGGVPDNTDNVHPKGNTYALIIGINYKNRKKFDPLNFAVSDAKLFKSFLQSGEFIDSLDDKRIKLILDSEATSANLFSAVRWMENVPKKDDKVIFYFAGHGTTPSPDEAFLIAYDAPDIDDPGAYSFQGGSIPVHTLKRIIGELKSKGVTTFLITDACRNSDAQNSFQDVFEDIMESNKGEIQFSSCSRNQSSAEDKKWGGGHGLFTFYLIKGLNGEADREGDKNGEVSLRELENYVTTHVENESRDLITNKPRQDPYINLANAVDRSQPIAYIRQGRDLNKLLQESNNLVNAKKRGLHDTTVLFQQFRKALDDKIFFKEQKNNAFDFLAQMKALYPIDEYEEAMQDYIIQLLNDAQLRINKYFEGIDTNYTNNYFAKGARELTVALSFMAKDHPLYKVYTVNRLFMEARSLNGVNAQFPIANRKLDSAIAIDSSIAYLYHVKGLYAEEDYHYREAIKYYKKARALSPDWSFPVYGLGNCYMNVGENQNALKVYAEEIARDSEAVFSWNNLGLLYESRFKKPDSALMCYKKAITLDPRFVIGYRNLGYLYSKLRNQTLALSMYAKAVSLDSLDESTWNSLGLFYAAQKKYDTAIAYYKRAIRLNSYYVYSLRNLGSVYEKLRKYSQALEYYKMAVAADKLNSDSWNQLGVFYFNRKEYDSSIFYYKKAISISPDYTLSLRNIGTSYEALHNDSLAMITYRQLLKVDPLNSDNWNQVAVFYDNRKKYDSAIFYYEKALRNDPDYVLSMRNLSKLYENLRLYQKEYTILLHALAIDSLNSDNWNQLGLYYENRKKYSDALRAYKKSVELDPSYIYGYRNQAGIYEELKDYPAALAMHQRVILLDSADEVSWNYFGLFCYGRQQVESAISCYQKALALNPDYTTALMNLSNAYDKMNQTGLSRNASLKALAIDPNAAGLWNHLGYFYDIHKQYDSAIYCYKKSFSLDANYSLPVRNLAIIYSHLHDEKKGEYYYTLAATADSLNVENWNALGDFYVTIKKYSEAKTCYLKSMALDPENTLCIIKLAHLDEVIARNDDALKLYRQAIHVDPQNRVNYNEIGGYYDNRGNTDSAIFYYQKALMLDSTYVTSIRNIGNAYSHKKNDKEALRYIFQGLHYEPDNAVVWNDLGVFYYERKNMDSAALCYRKALAIDPGYMLVIKNLLLIYKPLNQKQEIINLYRHAAEADDLNYVNWNDLGILYEAESKSDSAIYCYQKASALVPDSMVYLRNLGAVYEKVDSNDQALAAYKKAIHADPGNSVSWNYLGAFFHNKIKNYDSAQRCFKKALELDPKFILAAKNLRLAYLKLERNKEILPLMQQLVRANGNQGEAWFLAGNCYFTDNPDSAAYYYSNGIRKDSSFNDNYSAMGMLADNKKKYTEALNYYKKYLARDPANADVLGRMGYDYLYNEKYPEAHMYFQEEIKADTTNFEGYYDEACAYSRQKNMASGLQFLQMALDKKYTNLDHIKKDEDLTYLKQFPQFQELLKKYFPGKNVD